jgi:hypothetical protein
MFGWQLTRTKPDPAIMSDADLVRHLEPIKWDLWRIWRGITPGASNKTREDAGNIGLCIEGRIRELEGLI